jgi:hypothetical protein
MQRKLGSRVHDSYGANKLDIVDVRFSSRICQSHIRKVRDGLYNIGFSLNSLEVHIFLKWPVGMSMCM